MNTIKPHVKFLIAVFIISRIIIFLTSIFALSLPEGGTYFEVDTNRFINAWSQYDTVGYLDIALWGYYEGNENYFFPEGNYQWWPAFPMLLKLWPSTSTMPLFGFIISNLFFIFAIIILFKLFSEKFNDKIASVALSVLVFFPTSYFFSAVYTESMFLFFCALSMYMCHKKQWFWASVFGSVCALTRIYGGVLFIYLLYNYYKTRRFNINHKILYIFLIPLSFLTFCFHLYIITGNPLKILDHSQTNRHITFPFYNIIIGIKNIFISESIRDIGYSIFNMSIYLVLLILLVILFKISKEMFIYSGLIMFTLIISNDLQAIARYALSVFPVFLAVPYILSKLKRTTAIFAYLSYFIVSSIFLFVLTIWHTRGGYFIIG